MADYALYPLLNIILRELIPCLYPCGRQAEYRVQCNRCTRGQSYYSIKGIVPSRTYCAHLRTEYSRIRGGGPWGPGRMAVWGPFGGHMRTPPFPLKYCRTPLYRINSDTGPDSLPRGIRRNEVRIYVYFGGVQVVFHFLS